jgi:hypothetical protein
LGSAERSWLGSLGELAVPEVEVATEESDTGLVAEADEPEQTALWTEGDVEAAGEKGVHGSGSVLYQEVGPSSLE